jgi:hypothetical protein
VLLGGGEQHYQQWRIQTRWYTPYHNLLIQSVSTLHRIARSNDAQILTLNTPTNISIPGTQKPPCPIRRHPCLKRDPYHPSVNLFSFLQYLISSHTRSVTRRHVHRNPTKICAHNLTRNSTGTQVIVLGESEIRSSGHEVGEVDCDMFYVERGAECLAFGYIICGVSSFHICLYCSI